MTTRRALTPKQAAFVREHLVDSNATQAAIRAGYSARSAQEQSSRLLSNAMVLEAIRAGQAQLAEKTEITKEYLLEKVQRNLERAENEGSGGIVNQSAHLLAKMLGHIVDRVQMRVIRSVEDLSDEELEALLTSARRRIGHE